MKYTNLKIRERLGQAEYISLVDSIVNIQLMKDDNGNLEYHPEYLTTTLPSIVTAFCIEGIEFEDGDTLYDVDFINRIMADNNISSITDYIIYGVDRPEIPNFDYVTPLYFYRAIEDSKLIIEQRLKNATAAGQLLKIVSAFMTGVVDGIKKEDISGVLKKLTSENKTENKKLN